MQRWKWALWPHSAISKSKENCGNSAREFISCQMIVKSKLELQVVFFFLFFSGRINKTCLKTLRWPLFLSHSLFHFFFKGFFSPSWHGCVFSVSRTCVMLQPQGPRRVCLLWLKVNFSSTILQKLRVAVTYSQATFSFLFFKTKICIFCLSVLHSEWAIWLKGECCSGWPDPLCDLSFLLSPWVESGS